MASRLHIPIVCVALFVASTPACKQKPERPANLLYQVQSKDLSLVGATVLLGGERGTFTKRPWNATESIAQADVKVPRDAPGGIKEIALEMQTPCGTKKLDLKVTQTKADEDKARASDTTAFGVDLEPVAKLPPSVNVWVDADKEKIKVGSVELPQGRSRVFEPACAKSPVVTAGGSELGAFPVDTSSTDAAVFITTKKDVCYSFERVSYSAAGLGSLRTILRGKQVYAINADDIEFFLHPAPSSKKDIKHAHELVALPCADAK